MSDTYYHFAPSLRQGLAAAITDETDGQRAQIGVRLRAARRVKTTSEWDTDVDPFEQTVQLYGPGDVVGFDERMVVRTDPKPDSGNFEPNYFPAIEFDDPDFIWRFSAKPAEPYGLTPWIVLVVLIGEDRGEDIRREFEQLPRGRNQVPVIKVLNQTSLPDLEQAWRWAHIQATSGQENLSDEEIKDLLVTQPELVVSRLMCPRRLRPSTSYTALVVPAYRLGWAAGLDTPVAREQASDSVATDLAWDSNSDEPIDLPYYYRWEFRTSERGDFEFLVRLLEPRALSGLGLREIDCERPGFGLTIERSEVDDSENRHLLDMEGALQSLDTVYTHWGKDANGPLDADPPPPVPDPNEFQTRLAEDLLNRANADRAQVELPGTFDQTDILEQLEFDILNDGKSVRFSWRTENNATGRLEYGPEDVAGGYAYLETAISDMPNTEHEATVMLVPETTYHFQLVITDAGIETSTGDATIRVPLPVVVPPIYGRWHAARQEVVADQTHNGWLDVLNLDPRHRAAAGLGSEVVRKQQEPLMASAWDQIGAIEAANDVLRRAQFGREGSIVLHDRLGQMALEDFLRITTPAQKRVTRDNGTGGRKTIPAELEAETRIPAAALAPAFRRLARPRGPVRKRQETRRMDLLRRLGSGELRPAGPHPAPEGTPTPCDITTSMYQQAVYDILSGENGGVGPVDGGVIVDTGGLPGGLVTVSNTGSLGDVGTVASGLAADEGGATGDSETVAAGGSMTSGELAGFDLSARAEGPVSPGGTGLSAEDGAEIPLIVLIPDQIPVPENAMRFCDDRISCAQIRDAIEEGVEGLDEKENLASIICDGFEALLRLSITKPDKPAREPAFFNLLRDDIHNVLDPRVTVRDRTVRRLRLNNDIAQRFDEGASGDPLDEILAYPEFPQPMYEPLRDISKAHVLPGIEKVPQNTVGLLETNGRFLESYMVGLNHEFAGELLWRRYPTDQRGSYFRQFWDVSEYVGKEDLTDPNNSELDEEGRLKEEIQEALKDIRPVHAWVGTSLGDNDNRRTSGKGEMLVLVVRGDLLKRYPNAVVYAVDARQEGDELLPELPEFGGPDPPAPIYPIFRGSLGADLVFMGFPFEEADARSAAGNPGKFFVFEERVTEARFGLDSPEEPAPALEGWADLSWSHFGFGVEVEQLHYGGYLDSPPNTTEPFPTDDQGQTWLDASAATRAWITLQKPARLAVHADQMMPEE